MSRAWLLCIFVAVGCHSGFAIDVTLDVECPSVVSLTVSVVAKPSGETYTNPAADPATLRRIVVVPPAGTTSVTVAARALDVQGHLLAMNNLEVTVSGSKISEVSLPLLCGSCATGCTSDQLCCGSSCVEPATDAQNCGGCGLSCDGPHTEASSCASMTCHVDACASGFLDCDGDSANGCELDATDTTNGCACNQPACSTQHTSPSCAGGACKASCEMGWGDCNEDAGTDGCETYVLGSDPSHCGGCGVACPSGVCTTGVCARRVFVSSVNYTGNLGGVAGADAKCQTLADDASLGGTYKAWLATSTQSAVARLGTQRPGALQLVSGAKVADGFSELIAAGEPATAIDLDEQGAKPTNAGSAPIMCSIQLPVWSDALETGAPPDSSGSCSDWTSDTDATATYVGDATGLIDWSAQCRASCGGTAALYCFEQ